MRPVRDREAASASIGGRALPDTGDGPELEVIGRRVVTADNREGASPAPTAVEGAGTRLRGNVRDASVRFLLAALLAAQVADLVTTRVALQRDGMLERNPLFRMLLHSLPGVADALKLGAVLVIALIALAMLPVPRSRHALLFATALSMVAPIANTMMLLGRM